MFRLDRTAFSMGNHQEAEEKTKEYWQSQTMNERLKAAMYLNSIAFNFELENPPRMDKKAFKMRKHAK